VTGWSDRGQAAPAKAAAGARPIWDPARTLYPVTGFEAAKAAAGDRLLSAGRCRCPAVVDDRLLPATGCYRRPAADGTDCRGNRYRPSLPGAAGAVRSLSMIDAAHPCEFPGKGDMLPYGEQE